MKLKNFFIYTCVVILPVAFLFYQNRHILFAPSPSFLGESRRAFPPNPVTTTTATIAPVTTTKTTTPSTVSAATAAVPSTSPVPREITIKLAPLGAARPFADSSVAMVDSAGNLLINQVMVDGKFIVMHGDILVGESKDFDLKKKNHPPLNIAPPTRWPGGRVPFKIAKDLPNPERVLQAISYFNRTTDVHFNPHHGEKNYLLFKRGEHNCYSYLGMRGGEQPVSLADGCMPLDIVHEMLHALGFIHEQNRMDRDDHIEVHWDNIEAKYQMQFKKIPASFVDILATPFDFNSLMLYHPQAFAKEGTYSMTKVNGEPYRYNPQGLSYWDLERLQLIYRDEAD